MKDELVERNKSNPTPFTAKRWSHVTSAGWKLIIENSKFRISRGKMDHTAYIVNQHPIWPDNSRKTLVNRNGNSESTDARAVIHEEEMASLYGDVKEG